MRGNEAHEKALGEFGIPAIDLLVVNLYPFEMTVRTGADYDSCIENIDIGGPALIRAGAKNHASVAVVVEPTDYSKVLAEMEANDGATTLELRKALAAKAYARTSQYDAAIANWFADALQERAPEIRTFAGTLAQILRYGENPHQWAAFYRSTERRFGIATAVQLQGKELSYNNLNDTDAAYELVAEFDPAQAAAVAIIKHANPCGVAMAPSLKDAYLNAFRCDPVSAFGGIVALNRKLDKDTAVEIAKIFTEVIIAPDADDDAKAVIAEKKNLRLLLAGGLPDQRAGGVSFRSVAGGFLVQSRDSGVVGDLDFKVVTKRKPSNRGICRSDFRLCGRQARQVERDRLCEGRGDGRDRRRADEPRRCGEACGMEGRRRGKGARCADVADGRRGRRVRRVLSFRGRTECDRRSRDQGGDPAWRIGARRRSDRGRGRSGPRHGVHRHAAFPALIPQTHRRLDAQQQQQTS